MQVKQKQLSLDQVECQSPIDPHQEQYIRSLRALHTNINSDIDKMTDLKRQFFQTQQQKFVKTFINIMDHLSNELMLANEACSSIDREIENYPQCRQLSQQLQFYHSQCVELKQQLLIKNEALAAEKKKAKILEQQAQSLKQSLYKKTTKQLKYMVKARSLSHRAASVNQNKSLFSKTQPKLGFDTNALRRPFNVRSKSQRICTSISKPLALYPASLSRIQLSKDHMAHRPLHKTEQF